MSPDTPTSTVVESHPDDLPALPSEFEDAWQKVEQSGLGVRMRSALRRIACGENVRAAAELEGYASHADVYRAAKRYGLIDVRTSALIGIQRGIARLGGEELAKRVTENPDNISTRDLTVITGVAVDKVLASEKAATYDSGNYLSALEKLAERMAASREGIEIKVAISPTNPRVDMIDVTPEH